MLGMVTPPLIHTHAYADTYYSVVSLQKQYLFSKISRFVEENCGVFPGRFCSRTENRRGDRESTGKRKASAASVKQKNSGPVRGGCENYDERKNGKNVEECRK